jgi:hypothetical protein
MHPMLPGATDSFPAISGRKFHSERNPGTISPGSGDPREPAVQTDYRNRGQVLQAVTFGST